MAGAEVRPNAGPTLSQEQKERVNEWLKQKWLGPANCPVSRDVAWTIGDHLVVSNLFTPNAISIGGPAYPQVMLICRTCGYTMTFNAVVIGGLLPPDPANPTPGASEESAEPRNG